MYLHTSELVWRMVLSNRCLLKPVNRGILKLQELRTIGDHVNIRGVCIRVTIGSCILVRWLLATAKWKVTLTIISSRQSVLNTVQVTPRPKQS